MSKNISYEQFLNHDNFYTHEELVSQYGSPVSASFSSSLVIKNEELFYIYKNEDLLLVNNKEEKYISKRLVHDILSDEGMWKYIQTNLDNELGIALRIDYIIDGLSYAPIILTRAELINAINQIVFELNQKEQMRFAVIKNSWLIYSCEQRYKDYNHSVIIDGSTLEIPATTLLDILTCDEETFKQFLNDVHNYGYDKECLAYSLVDFIERERILTKYVLPDAAYNRYINIRDYSLIDFESLNKNRIANDLDKNGESVVKKVILADDLWDYLDQYIDKTYSNFEKAIYYYLKLCEILTYDENYFLTKSGSVLETHEDISNINKVTPTNNKIVKYDFAIIFASILDKLQIDYTINQNLMAGLDPSGPMLTFRYAEYLVSLNSIANPSISDLVNVKINDEVINLTCTNKNEVTKNKFSELLNRIYSNIKIKKEETKTFRESLELYKANNTTSVSLQEKLSILLHQITRTNLKGIDAIGYEKKIIENLFGETNLVNVTYLCKESQKNYLSPVTIISVQSNNQYTYFIVDHTRDEVVKKVTQEQLQNILGLGIFYYIEDEKIPGINNNIGEKYVR